MIENERRRTVAIVCCYLIAAAGWIWFGSAIAPDLIARGLRGEGPSSLVHAVKWFAWPRPQDKALEAWRVSYTAFAAGLLLHGLLVLAIGRWGRGARGLDRLTCGFLIVVSLAFLLVTALSGPIQDYYLHLDIWREVVRGNDPWFLVTGGNLGQYSLNAYGPLFNLLALPTVANPLAPKMVFAASYWFFASYTILAVGRRRGLPAWVGACLALGFASPFAWFEIAWFGHFDVVVALLCVAAVEARLRGRWGASAAWLASGILLKFLPGILAPFLAVDRGRIRWRYLAATAGLSLSGMGIAWLIWGTSAFRPIYLAVNRESDYLSIYRYLRGIYSPIGRDTLFFSPDEYATPVLLFALYEAWRWVRRSNFDPLGSSVLAVTITLGLYKVGFPQYYMVLFLLGPYWFARDYATIRRRGLLAATFVACFGWVTWFDARIVRGAVGMLVHWVGVPMFLLMATLAASIVLAAPRSDEGPIGEDATGACVG